MIQKVSDSHFVSQIPQLSSPLLSLALLLLWKWFLRLILIPRLLDVSLMN